MTVRCDPEPGLVGGPLDLVWGLINRDAVPLQLLVGGERATGRPAFFQLTAHWGDEPQPLADPHAGAPGLGGPAFVSSVAPGAVFEQRLLVNDFCALEALLPLVAPGGQGLLRLGVRRTLTAPGRPGLRPLELCLPLRRDDAALQAHLDDLAEQVRFAPGGPAALSRQRALASLLALRHGGVRTQLARLATQLEPELAVRVRQALATLPD